jgi:hypothetical protein
MQRELGPDSAAFKQLAENQIVPHIGAKLMQKVARLDLEAWHTTLRNGGLAARTIGHAHRVLGKALSDAERDGLVVIVAKLRGAALYVPAMLALFTGMRLGEVLALRWSRVDLDGKTISVREALESTTAHGPRFKAPKSKACRRDIKLPEIVVTARTSQASAGTADAARGRALARRRLAILQP